MTNAKPGHMNAAFTPPADPAATGTGTQGHTDSRPASSAPNAPEGVSAYSASADRMLEGQATPEALPSAILAGDGLLRAEVFSGAQLARHGRALSAWHRVDRGRGRNPLLTRLDQNEAVLREVIVQLRAMTRTVPAGDWLLDNHYLVLEQITTVRRHLPRRYSRELPRLTVGAPVGYPRVYALALELIAHADGRVDEDSLTGFISGYQSGNSSQNGSSTQNSGAVLTMGELWAIPTMLRLALIENLRRIAVRVADTGREHSVAAVWAERLGRVADDEPSELVLGIADLARDATLSAGFVAELHHRLQGQNPAVGLVLQWLEQRLAGRQQTVAELIRTDHQAQATDQLAVDNAITSLRRMGTIDWRAFVEGLSPVEAVLRRDPAAIYGRMDPATRDRYRHVVEGLARRCRVPGADTEIVIAQTVLALSTNHSPAGSNSNQVEKTPESPLESHVGWWLLGDGEPQLEQHLAQSHGLRRPRKKCATPRSLWSYLIPLVALSLALSELAGWAAYRVSTPLPVTLASPWITWGLTVAVALLALLPASQLALALVNWLGTHLVTPQTLPRLDLSEGIPPELRCLVVIPTLLRTPGDVIALSEGLLVRQLANRDDELGFALLTDFGDAATAELPTDATLLAQATAAIAALNARHGAHFLLLHRPRQWNASEGVWMGRERKRGKLEDLNRLLLHGERGSFSLIAGAEALLREVRQVIVLDTDTRLPRDGARLLIATLAHPLNRPRLDRERGVVTHGHAILQPRAAIGLASSQRTWFASLWAGDAGLDPYTRALSDVYQDWFDAGSFVGKGIYDVAAFEAVLHGRFPANAILSHDLIEGAHARAGLVSDVLVVEDFPARYLADVARRKRWIRGDWQLLPWLRARVPTADGHARNQLDALGRWKIFDNLRRSLVAPSTVALLLLAWATLPNGLAAIISAAVVAGALAPALLGAAGTLRPPQEIPLPAHLRRVGDGLLRGVANVAFELAVLPFEAATALGAIARTLWRLTVSRRRLLEWQTSTDAERLASGRLLDVLRTMLIGPLVAGVACWLISVRPGVAPAALPFALAWACGPFAAWWLSRPRRGRAISLGRDDHDFLRLTARRTWRYFAEQVTAADHHLPPDNVQELPTAAVAHRTSPTNIGLALLANVAAHDLGWLTTDALLKRTEATLGEVLKLERYRGHLLNWYDTVSGNALNPRYVSTVDSGNLAGHLLVLAAALREISASPMPLTRRLSGVRTTLRCAGLPAIVGDELTTLGATATALAERVQNPEAREWCLLAAEEARAHAAEVAAEIAHPDQSALRERVEALAATATDFALAMDWGFLLDPRTKLFAIGFQVDDARTDRSAYDLLASESRLGSFVAVAAGGIAQEHWFRLGRQQVRTPGGHALLSWSGTMFEYLMPALVMPEEYGTLLHDSNCAAVAEQIRYARSRGIPWGISESAYYVTDAQLNWQYRAFGVPGLGLKRGLADDLVVAPYASALALLIEPAAAIANLRHLEELGAVGRFGFCEALDFTTARLPLHTSHVVIRSWMAHHQGMTLLGCLHVLEHAPMRRRFLADPRLLAHRLLLQERPALAMVTDAEPVADAHEGTSAPARSLRVITEPYPAMPEVHLLSNGRYHVLVTSSGAGGSRWGDLALTRWRADPTAERGGPVLYLRDLATGRAWSTTWQPIGGRPSAFEAVFTQARAEFRRRDGPLAQHTEIAVSPEDDVELRRTTLTNHGDTALTIELTTYAEPVLAPAAAEAAHPAFSNLFVETEAVPAADAVLASRRPRRAGEARPYLAQVLVVRSDDNPNAAAPATISALSWETDRHTFIGRGRTPGEPSALSRSLNGVTGAVLDACLALRRSVTIAGGARVVIDVVYAAAETRAAVLALANRYRDTHLAERVFSLAWTHGQVVLAQLGGTEAEAQVFARLAGALVLPTAHRRAPAVAIARNQRTRSALWSHGISGDLPVCLLRVGSGQRLELARQLLRAHAWWRARGLAVDLVILIEDPSVYRQELTERVIGLVAASPAAGLLDRAGGIYVRRCDQVPEEDRHLLAAVARLAITDAGGSLAQFAERRVRPESPPLRFVAARPGRTDAALPTPRFELLAFNGLGGFTRDGREYITVLPPGVTTPLPWANVLANAEFGSVVSERGAAYTWSGNCHEFRLTPWHCDAVSDPAGEAVWLRDEDSGATWSPTQGPLPARAWRVVRHGFGYSAFQCGEEGIDAELHQWVDVEAPVKHLRLRVANRSGRARRLTAWLHLDWTLGELRERTAPNLLTEHDAGVLYARNPLHDEESARCAFVAVSRAPQSWTCDRAEVLGRGGDAGRPAALRSAQLLSRAGAALDPCATMQVALDLEPGQEQELVFTIGCGRDRSDATALAFAHRGLEPARASLARVYEHWKRLLGAVRVRTSDQSLDLLANGWLAYQVIACRVLARSGYSQSGGAFGFRDQLQDTMALVHHAPQMLRAQIVRCAGRQFRDGDVQHWWHPPRGRGVRTHISDDYLWLPYALARYLDATNDHGVLDERLAFLEMPAVPADQESIYDLPGTSDEQVSVYEHAVRAVLHGLRFGAHGLPLMGTGDWNDGMDRVGHHGKGESVWLAFFLIDVLRRFAPVARARGDVALAERLSTEATGLAERIDAHAWADDRYLRAWMDDGTPLGDPAGEACRIDALPQAWAALTGACDPARTRTALDSVDRLLVRRDEGLIQLFDPPFDHGSLDPGYIKGYVPGVRENGGQYTHAAVWTAMAFAAVGDGVRALELARLIDPVRHGMDPQRWQGEPYVLAADVYRCPGHIGRAGWTWYTGSAGWMLRLLLESLLGLQREGDHLRVIPGTPKAFGDYEIDYRVGATLWRIRVRGDGVVRRLSLDGVAVIDFRIPLLDDGGEHTVEVQRD